MSNRNHTQATPPVLPAERIRRLWPAFKQSVSKSRILLEHKIEAVLDKAEKDYEKTAPEQRRPIDLHNAHKAKLAKDIRVPHFKSVRRQWEVKLQEVGLRMESWTDMSNEEMASVLDVLGDPEDELDDNAVVPDRESPPNPTFSSASLASYATPPQPLAPSLSSSTRSTNVSTASSYAFVDPSEFHSEEEDSGFFFPVATSYDLTSDDDDRPIQRRQNGFDAWSSDSSSHHSFDGPSNTRFPQSALPSNSRKMTSAGKQAASLKEKETELPKARQSYVGPIVTDPDEPLSEEEDFERFKMNVRLQKIIEFHQAAAHADIELAIAVYKDRMAQNGDNQEVSSKVTIHQKRMMQLQMEKEEERKNIVKAERSKRRSELRRRPGRSGTLIAPRPSVPTNPSWLDTFQEQVAGEVNSNILLDDILSRDPREQAGNVEKLLEQLFPGSSSVNEDKYNHIAPAFSQGWGTPTTSSLRPADVKHEATPVNVPKKFPNGRSTKQSNVRVAKPSLFGEHESSDEDQDSPSPPVSVPIPSQPSNSFVNAEADSMLARHLMADPEIYSYLNQWGTAGELPSMPTHPTPWGMSQAAQTPTVDNPDPWTMKDVRSTPVATRRKSSFSSSLQTPTQNPYNAFVAEQSGVSLATLAAFNSVNANAKEKPPSVTDERRSVLESVKRFSPSEHTPAPAPPAPTFASSTSTITPQAKADTNPPLPLTGKKQNKKQRQGMKKPAAGTFTIVEDSTQAPESFVPPAEKTPMISTFEQIPHPGVKPTGSQVEANVNGNVDRGRKDSTSAWGELLSTPRPAPNVPAHLQGTGFKPESTQPNFNKPVEQFRSTSGMSTIKAPPRGSALKNRTAWSIFSPSEPGPSKPLTETPGSSGSRDLWLPGSFEVNDGGGDDGGGGQDDQMVNGASFSAQFLGPAPSAHNKSAQQGSRSDDIYPPSAPNSKAVPVSQQSSSLSPSNKRAKNKKGKKKVTVEEVPEEDDQDSRGERLPLDHRYIMESSTILEPKPSVPPRMFDSIIGFGDEDEDEGGTTSSSFATAADRGSSSPSDPFDGDAARLAAAMQEIQESSARMERRFAGTPASGVGNGVKKTNIEPETSTPIFAWGQPIVADRRRGSVSNAFGTNAVPKPAIAPTMKRSKAASGGKLL